MFFCREITHCSGRKKALLSMGVVKMARYWPIKTRKRTMNTQPSSWNKLGQNETITWLKRDLIIAGPTPSVQEGLIFPSRMVIIAQEMVRENYSSRSGKSQRISLWVRENLSLWKKSRLSEILRVHIFFINSWTLHVTCWKHKSVAARIAVMSGGGGRLSPSKTNFWIC